MMGDITKNFSRWEYACSDKCGFDDVVIAHVEAIQALRDLVSEVFERDVKVTVNSGCRCEAKNAAVGGSDKSRHKVGDAGDYIFDGIKAKDIVKYAEQIPDFHNGGLGLYESKPYMIHLDSRGFRARWEKP